MSSSSLSDCLPLRLLRAGLLATRPLAPRGAAAGRPRLPAPVEGRLRLGAY